MNKRRFGIMFLLLSFLMGFVSPVSVVFADGEAGEENEIPVSQRERDLLEVLLGTDPSTSAIPVYIADPSGSSAYQETFAMGENAVFTQSAETYTLTFEVPTYWKPRYVYAQVYATTLQQRSEKEPAAFTFFLNEEPITAYRISEEQGKDQIYTILLPLEKLKIGENTLDIGAYVQSEENSTLDGSGWLVVKDATKVILGYDLAEREAGISDYPYPFVSSLDPTGSKTAVVVSNEEELGAALKLRGNLGSHTRKADEISLVTSEHATGYANTIRFLQEEDLNEEQRSAIEEVFDLKELGDADCVLVLQDTENGKDLILLSKTPKGFENGIDALLQQDGTAMGEKIRLVSHETPEASLFGREEPITLEDLKGEGLSFYGTLQNEQVIALPSANGAVLGENGEITMHSRYSENLDFERSLMTVYWGDVPIASHRMQEENAADDVFTFALPKDIEGSWAEEIRVRYDLYLPGNTMAGVDRMPWAYVCEDSTFTLPLAKKTSGDLKDAGSLLLNEETGKVTIGVPAKMTPEELSVLGQLASMYADCAFEVVPISEINPDCENLILLGCGDDNERINELAKTYQGLFLQEEGIAGGMQMVETESGQNLVVWAEDAKEMDHLKEVLSQENERKHLKNNTMLVNEKQGVQYAQQEAERIEEPSEPVEEKPFGHPWPWMIAGVCILGVILVFVRAGMR